MRRIFRSLRSFNYRIWAAGALVSNVGTWMQRAAQDWLVLTELTHHNASAVGIVMALQFGPQFLLMPWTSFAADHFNQRRLLIATQAAMGVLALILGVLTITGSAQLWHVYVFAFLFGCSAAFAAPVRQTFVAELVGDSSADNAGSLVQASAPVQVISGMPCTFQPFNSGDKACDHLEQTVLPAETLGKHYFVSPPTSPHAALDLLNLVQSRTGGAATTFELMKRLAIEVAVRHGPGCRDPLATPFVMMGVNPKPQK